MGVAPIREVAPGQPEDLLGAVAGPPRRTRGVQPTASSVRSAL